MAKETKPDASFTVTGSDGKTRKPRKGDESREICTRCPKDGEVHFMYEKPTSASYIWIKLRCPNCGNEKEIPKPNYEAIIKENQARAEAQNEMMRGKKHTFKRNGTD